MKLEETIILRMPEGTSQKAEDLIKSIENDSNVIGFGKVTKSTVLRLATLEGLKVLQKRYKKKADK